MSYPLSIPANDDQRRTGYDQQGPEGQPERDPLDFGAEDQGSEDQGEERTGLRQRDGNDDRGKLDGNRAPDRPQSGGSPGQRLDEKGQRQGRIQLPVRLKPGLGSICPEPFPGCFAEEQPGK
jgi:hypothetical protein